MLQVVLPPLRRQRGQRRQIDDLLRAPRLLSGILRLLSGLLRIALRLIDGRLRLSGGPFIELRNALRLIGERGGKPARAARGRRSEPARDIPQPYGGVWLTGGTYVVLMPRLVCMPLRQGFGVARSRFHTIC